MRCWRVMIGALPVAFVAAEVAADVPAAPGERAVVRVAPERSVAGVSSEEYFDRQQELHASLLAEMPEGVLDTPIRVQLTRDEHVSLENVTPSGPGPVRIGLVKRVSPPVEVAGPPKGQLFKGGRPVAGVLSATDDGGLVWATTIESADAGGIRVHFTNFSLPDDASLYFFNLEGEAYGPYQGRGPNGDGEFWSHSVFSSSGVILLRVAGPATPEDLQGVSFVITHIGHIGADFPDRVEEHGDGICGNESCILDASCHSHAAVADAEDAVAEMEWIAGAWIYTCTGGLIADTDAGSEIPYFLTANHCLNKNKDAKNLECFFFYRTSSCGASCPSNSGFPKTVGSSVKASGRNGDFTLLELNQNPPSGTVYLGWNNAPVAFTGGLDLYRISHPNFGAQVYSHHQVDAETDTCQGWPRGERIYSTDIEGATDGGSSGSPVVNSSGEDVGQLSGCCGYNCGDPCDSASNWTVDGALAFYWDQVAQFLDPSPCVPVPEVCDNGVDDDCDGLVDCDDTADCPTGVPPCECSPVGAGCTDDAECCSNKCKGRTGRKTCK